jgi:exopolysaccharide biosynthesis polyprenyl glycosylphosphotransferase
MSTLPSGRIPEQVGRVVALARKRDRQALPEPPAKTAHPAPLPVRARRESRWIGALWAVALSAVLAVGVSLWLEPTGALVPVALSVSSVLALWTVALPNYERSTSIAPSRSVAVLSGGALLGVELLVPLTTDTLRQVMIVVLAGLAVPVLTRWAAPQRRLPRATLLIGDRLAVSQLITQWRERPEVDMVGICLVEPDDDAESLPSSVMGLPVVGGVTEAADCAVRIGVDQVVVAPGPVLTAYDVRRLSWALEATDVELTVAAEVHGATPDRIAPRLLGRRLLLAVRPTRRSHLSVGFKSAFDRIFGTLLLLVALPVIGILVLLVRLDSPGPGFFRQQRAGLNGRAFTMYKLRSMRLDAEELRVVLEEANEGAGPLFKLQRDPRVTRVGRFLRSSSLDEVPQLINVVKGEMSLIGPRPALPSETDEYDDWIRRRLSVKPGITGLWQVSGRSSLSWNEAVRLDLDYVDNWTHTRDLHIFARTLDAVARRKGAW